MNLSYKNHYTFTMCADALLNPLFVYLACMTSHSQSYKDLPQCLFCVPHLQLLVHISCEIGEGRSQTS